MDKTMEIIDNCLVVVDNKTLHIPNICKITMSQEPSRSPINKTLLHRLEITMIYGIEVIKNLTKDEANEMKIKLEEHIVSFHKRTKRVVTKTVTKVKGDKQTIIKKEIKF